MNTESLISKCKRHKKKNSERLVEAKGAKARRVKSVKRKRARKERARRRKTKVKRKEEEEVDGEEVGVAGEEDGGVKWANRMPGSKE